MDVSDAESSASSTDGCTSTDVLLGYVATELAGDPISQLGGYPAWPNAWQPPPLELATCKVCHSLMSLLVQLDGNLPAHFPHHERRLYIFTCRDKRCQRQDGSVRALRATGTPAPTVHLNGDTTSTSNELSAGSGRRLGDTIFGGSQMKRLADQADVSRSTTSAETESSTAQDPLSSASKAAGTSPVQAVTASQAAGDLTATFAEKVRVSEQVNPKDDQKPAPWPLNDAFPPPFPKLPLEADYELLDESAASSRAPDQVDINDSTGDNGLARDDATAFESRSDDTFQRFADRLAQNPEQVIRYKYGGAPLLYSKTDTVGTKLLKRINSSSRGRDHGKLDATQSPFPPCQCCRSRRSFELQVMPHAITVVEAEATGSDSMEWGTLILAVCSNDCHRGNGIWYTEEWIGVQWEERTR